MQEECKLTYENSDYRLLIDGNQLQTRLEAGNELNWLSIILEYSILQKKAAKTNFAVKGGKFMFEVKYLESLITKPFEGPDAQTKNQFMDTLFSSNKRHLVRVGYSTAFSKPSLGTDFESCGYENSGVKYYGTYQKQYGETFEPGDVIRCCIDLEDQFNIYFYKNGVSMGLAFTIPQKHQDKGYFPTICLRNARVEVNFNKQTEMCPLVPKEQEEKKMEEESDSKIKLVDPDDDPEVQMQKALLEQIKKTQQDEQNSNKPKGDTEQEIELIFQWVGNSKEEQREQLEKRQTGERQTLIMMVGLPGCGKSTFAKHLVNLISLPIKYIKSEGQQGTVKINNLQENMITLMEICDEILIKQIELAAQTHRDVLIDQCNLFLKARYEKLLHFSNFIKEAFIIVLTEQEQQRRLQKKEKFLRQSEIPFPRLGFECYRNMKQNFVIPSEQEGFHKLHFIELNEMDSRKVVIMNNLMSQQLEHPLLRPKEYKKIQQNIVEQEQLKIQQEEERIKQEELRKFQKAEQGEKQHDANENDMDVERNGQEGEPQQQDGMDEENGYEQGSEIPRDNANNLPNLNRPPIQGQQRPTQMAPQNIQQPPQFQQSPRQYQPQNMPQTQNRQQEKNFVKNAQSFNRLSDRQDQYFPYSGGQQQPQRPPQYPPQNYGGQTYQQAPFVQQPPPHQGYNQGYPPQQPQRGYPPQRPQQYPPPQQGYGHQYPPHQGGYYQR